MADDQVQAALGSSLYAIQFGTILWVAAATTLILVSVPNAVASLTQFLTGSDLSSGASRVIAGIVLVFGLYMVWTTRRNMRDRIRAKIEEARRTQVEATLEAAALRPPILR